MHLHIKLHFAKHITGVELEEKHAAMMKLADKTFRMECMGTGSEVDDYVTQMTDKVISV